MSLFFEEPARVIKLNIGNEKSLWKFAEKFGPYDDHIKITIDGLSLKRVHALTDIINEMAPGHAHVADVIHKGKKSRDAVSAVIKYHHIFSAEMLEPRRDVQACREDILKEARAQASSQQVPPRKKTPTENKTRDKTPERSRRLSAVSLDKKGEDITRGAAEDGLQISSPTDGPTDDVRRSSFSRIVPCPTGIVA